MPFAYILFHISILSIALFGARLYPGGKLPHLKRSVKAISLPAFLFIIIDAITTHWFWSFNPDMILGIFIGPLPIEEILFFFTAPYAILIFWENLRSKTRKIPVPLSLPILYGLLGCSITVYGAYNTFWYTAFSGICLLIPLFIDTILKTYFFRSYHGYIAIGIIVLCTSLFNNYLTGLPVVIYNTAVKSGLLIGTMPVEDIGFGIGLITLIIIMYEILPNHSSDHFN